MAAKRAINSGVAPRDERDPSHGDENLDSTELGMIAAIDGSQTGDIKTTKWAVKGTEFGFSSPVIDGQRFYQLDNSAVLHAFDLGTGRLIWTHEIGTLQKAPLVMADGKLYVGTENGRFFIIRPLADRAEVLSEVQMLISTNSAGGSEGTPEQIFSGAAVSRGRVYFMSSDAVYAIGPKAAKPVKGFAADEPAIAGEGAPAYVQVSPTEESSAGTDEASCPLPTRDALPPGRKGRLVAGRAERHRATGR